MRVARSLIIFASSLFVGLFLYNYLAAKGWIPLPGDVRRVSTLMLPSFAIPLGSGFSIPLLIAFVAAGTAMVFGMWKVAKTGAQLAALIFGLFLICVFVPLASMIALILAACTFGRCP